MNVNTVASVVNMDNETSAFTRDIDQDSQTLLQREELGLRSIFVMFLI